MSLTTTQKIPSNLQVIGHIQAGDGYIGFSRDDIEQEDLAAYPLRMEEWRVWDAMGTFLPTAPTTDDLGFAAGTPGTSTPMIVTEDVKAVGSPGTELEFAL